MALLEAPEAWRARRVCRRWQHVATIALSRMELVRLQVTNCLMLLDNALSHLPRAGRSRQEWRTWIVCCCALGLRCASCT